MLPRLIVVDRENHSLDLYVYRLRKRRYALKETFTVTVGKVGSETPHGLYFVQSKSRKPDWQVPPSPDYPSSMHGHIFKFGQNGNPFAGGFISLAGDETGIGIHGTSFDPKVGTDSSHGCVRMRTEDLLKIYDHCFIGMPVYLH